MLAILEDEEDDRFGQGSVSTTVPGTTVFSRPRVAPVERRVDATSAVEELEFLLSDPRASLEVLAGRLGAARRALQGSARWSVASYASADPRDRFDSHADLSSRLDAIQAELERRLGRELTTREAYVGLYGMGGDPLYEQTWGPEYGGTPCLPRNNCPPVVVQQGCCPGEQQPSWPWSWNELDPRPRSVPGWQPPQPQPQPQPSPPPQPPPPPEEDLRDWVRLHEPLVLPLEPDDAVRLPPTGEIPFGPEGYLSPQQAVRLWEPTSMPASVTQVDQAPMPAVLVGPAYSADPVYSAGPTRTSRQYVMPRASAGGVVVGSGGGEAGAPAARIGTGGLMGFLGRLFGMGGGGQQDALAAQAVLAAGGPGQVIDRLTPLIASGGGVQVEAMQVLTQGGGAFTMDELHALASLPAPWAAEVATRDAFEPLPPLGLVGERF